jgi:peptidoglycan hydrolase-like protein with peptidoglycan-binding domain
MTDTLNMSGPNSVSTRPNTTVTRTNQTVSTTQVEEKKALQQPDLNQKAASEKVLGTDGKPAATAIAGDPTLQSELDHIRTTGNTGAKRISDLGIGEAGAVDPKELAALEMSQRAVVDAGVAIQEMKPGESMQDIATRFDTSVAEIKKLNPQLGKYLEETVGKEIKAMMVAVPIGASAVSGAPASGQIVESGPNAYKAAAPKMDDIRSGKAVMHRGMGGPEVMDLQRKLNAMGAKPPLAVDGKFGPKTEAALKAGQASNGVQTTGVLGRQSLAMLDANPKPISEQEMTRHAPPASAGSGSSTVSGAAANLSGTALGNRVDEAAERSARQLNSVGRCALGVNNALESLGIPGRGHAYQKASQLASNGKFREVNIGSGELANLPPGAVVVWGRSAAKPYGHVSVALGGGREASDHVQRQITGGRYGTDFGSGPDPQGRQFRVFLPN